MLIKLCITLFCALLFINGACDGPKAGGNQTPSASNATSQSAETRAAASPDQASQPSASPASSDEKTVRPSLDVCSLLSNSEIAAVQGGQVQSATPSQQASKEFAVSACYYTVASTDRTKNLSVHMQVIQAAPENSKRNAMREYWEKKFEGKGDDGEREEEEGEREEGEAGKPQPVRGVGDKALWFGNSMVGMLYVLKNDKLVRISVGGQTDARARLEKSKALAAKALKRLT